MKIAGSSRFRQYFQWHPSISWNKRGNELQVPSNIPGTEDKQPPAHNTNCVLCLLSDAFSHRCCFKKLKYVLYHVFVILSPMTKDEYNILKNYMWYMKKTYHWLISGSWPYWTVTQYHYDVMRKLVDKFPSSLQLPLRLCCCRNCMMGRLFLGNGLSFARVSLTSTGRGLLWYNQ